jgi:hypothetical protein
VFGIAVIALGVWGFNFTRDHTKRQGSASGRSKTRRSRSMLPTPARHESTPSQAARWSNSACSRPRVAFTANRVWSIYGAERAQPVATGRKWDSRANGSNKPKPLPLVATSCRSDGKEGVDGSSPSEGSAKATEIAAFCVEGTCTSSSMRWGWSRLWSSRSTTLFSWPARLQLWSKWTLMTGDTREGRKTRELSRVAARAGASADAGGIAPAEALDDDP